ncbi:MAG: DUF357 domain-containing protein [Candidatus Bathyarchaeia archaeon]
MKTELERRVAKYITSVGRVLDVIEKAPKGTSGPADAIIETVKRYFSDAKYYKSQNDLVSSLATVAYCEGLLDALRMQGLAEFEWE